MKKLKWLLSLKFLLPLTFVLITATIIWYPQHFLRVLPLYFSLGIMALNSKANRFGFLLGSINSVLYGLVYWKWGLYASMASALLMSFPLQLITFFLWSRRKYRNSTLLRSLTGKQLTCIIGATALLWCVSYTVLSFFGAKQIVLDNTGALMGMLSTVLAMLSFKEYYYFQLASLGIGITVYIVMMSQHPEQLTYLIYNCYAAACSLKAGYNMKRLYREQQSENTKRTEQERMPC